MNGDPNVPDAPQVHDADYYYREAQVQKARERRRTSLIAVSVIAEGATLTSVGIALWVAPGAGIATLGILVFFVGILIGFRS